MDLWGIGCVLFEMIALYPLFPGKNELDQLRKIHKVLGIPKDIMYFKRISGSHINFDALLANERNYIPQKRVYHI